MSSPVEPVTNFHESFDARDWATAWAATIAQNPSVPFDDGAMIAWFANALMRGYDHAKAADRAELSAHSLELQRLRKALDMRMGELMPLRRAADRLAARVNEMVDSGTLSARSLAADALLDYATERYGDADPIGCVRNVSAALAAAAPSPADPVRAAEPDEDEETREERLWDAANLAWIRGGQSDVEPTRCVEHPRQNGGLCEACAEYRGWYMRLHRKQWNVGDTDPVRAERPTSKET